MTFPTPVSAVAGASDVENVARQLFEQIGWLKRLSTEIIAENPVLNAMKMYQLADMAGRVKETADAYRNGGGTFRDIVVAMGRLIREKTAGFQSLTDAEVQTALQDLYAANNTFLIWALANLPQGGATLPNTTVTILSPDFPHSVELRVSTPLPAGTLTRVQALNAAFG
jgi:hypothetical protein